MQPPITRLYTLGDLLEDLHHATIDDWHREIGRGQTLQYVRERKLERVQLQFSYAVGNVAWVSVTVTGKRSVWHYDATYRVLRRPNGMYELDPRSIR